MAVIKISQFLLAHLGLVQTQSVYNCCANILHKLHILLVVIIVLSVLLPSASILVIRVENLNEATDVLYTVTGFTMISSAYLIFLYQRINIEKLIENLEKTVKQSVKL